MMLQSGQKRELIKLTAASIFTGCAGKQADCVGGGIRHHSAMQTLYRAKSTTVRGGFLAGVAALMVWVGAGSAAPFYGSLYTPVREGQAIGPLPDEPPAYYPYQPKEMRTLEELPAAVRAAAVAHVKARVGEEFYARLRFAGGQFVDVEELHRVNPASRKFRAQVPAYLLRFDFEMPKSGIRHYTASMGLRGGGEVIRELDLPASAKEPRKTAVKALAEVCAGLVKQRLIDPAAATATVTYDRKGDRLVWHFEQALPGGAGQEVKVRTVEVDAHTGKVIRQS